MTGRRQPKKRCVADTWHRLVYGCCRGWPIVACIGACTAMDAGMVGAIGGPASIGTGICPGIGMGICLGPGIGICPGIGTVCGGIENACGGTVAATGLLMRPMVCACCIIATCCCIAACTSRCRACEPDGGRMSGKGLWRRGCRGGRRSAGAAMPQQDALVVTHVDARQTIQVAQRGVATTWGVERTPPPFSEQPRQLQHGPHHDLLFFFDSHMRAIATAPRPPAGSSLSTPLWRG